MHKNRLDPERASSDDCIDFLHYLFSGEEEHEGRAAKKGKKAKAR